MAKISWIASELILLDDEHSLCGFFANIFDCKADVYVVFLCLLCTKHDLKPSNKNNQLREVNAKYLHSPTNSLNEPILVPLGLYTDEQHSFMGRYA